MVADAGLTSSQEGREMATGRLSCRRRGFSFTEVVIVLAILAIIATTSVSLVLSAVPHAQLETAELAVVSDLAQYRYIALSEEVPVRVQFDVEAGTWQAEKLVDGTWVSAAPPGELEAGCAFAADGVTFPGQLVEFTSRGSLLAGGSISITSSQGELRVLSGNLATGRFVISEGNLR